MGQGVEKVELGMGGGRGKELVNGVHGSGLGVGVQTLLPFLLPLPSLPYAFVQQLAARLLPVQEPSGDWVIPVTSSCKAYS